MKHLDRTQRTEVESFVVGGRVTGPSHMKAGKGCDDAFAWISFPEGAQVLAVADGAGSVTGTSAWGSWAATQFVTWEPVARFLVSELSVATDKSRASKILKSAFIGALNNIHSFGSFLDLSVESMNTTLCVAVIVPNHTYVAEIGDGIVAIMGEDKKARTVLIEAKGDSAATDTYFLQLLENDNNHKQWRFEDFGPVPAIALSTDGLRYQATSITKGYAAYPGLFEGLWELLKAGKLSRDKLENWLNTKVSQSDPPGDDKTLLVAIRPSAVSDSLNGGIKKVLRDCSPEPSRLLNNNEGSGAPDPSSPGHHRQDRGAPDSSSPGHADAQAENDEKPQSLFERISSLFHNFLSRFSYRRTCVFGNKSFTIKQRSQSLTPTDPPYSSSHYEVTRSRAYDVKAPTRPESQQQISNSSSSSRPNPSTEKRRPRRPRPHHCDGTFSTD